MMANSLSRLQSVRRSRDARNERLYWSVIFPRLQAGEFQFYFNQLWTAPELLRMTTRPINGTQKADVYSFAIILQEIMFRAEPYFVHREPPKGECRVGTQRKLSLRLLYLVSKGQTDS